MSQITEYVTPGTPLTMAALASFLNDAFAAIASANRGTTAPDNPVEGMLWWDSSANPEILKRYTVTGGWASLLSVNITTGAVAIQSLTLAAAATGFTIAGGTTPKTLTVDETRSITDLMLSDGSNLAIGSDADGDIYYRASSVLARLAKGTANQKLQMNSSATAPEWATDPLSPWLIDIDVFSTATNSNWSIITVVTDCILNGYRLSSGDVNAYVEFPVVLSAGTWTFSLIHNKNTDVGIYTVSLDGDSQGTIDGYNAGGVVRNVVSTITGITVATPGKKALRLTMATKNAGSSSYAGAIQTIRMLRTA